jgi:trigger factor
VEIAEGELARGNVPQLERAKVGQTREFDYAFPADYPVPEVAGKTAHFKVQLKVLKVQITPELNDELAKEVQGGETLEELKGKIRGDLERSLRSKASQQEREQLIGLLAEKNKFEIPRAMVDRAIDAMLRGAIRAMAEQGMDVQKMGLDFDRLREEMRPKALLEVQGTLLFEAIAEKEGIQASEEDVDKRLEQAAAEQKIALSQLRKQFRGADERRQLQMRVREEKTVEFLKAKASY